MRFHHQYLINTLISDFNFWNLDRHERKEPSLLTGFLKKFLFGQMGPKMVPPHNSGSALRIFLKFSTLKGANR